MRLKKTPLRVLSGSTPLVLEPPSPAAGWIFVLW